MVIIKNNLEEVLYPEANTKEVQRVASGKDFMKPAPRLKMDFILNEQEYQICKTWLNDANEQTILHPLEDAELENQRRQMKSLVEEYETNWRGRA